MNGGHLCIVVWLSSAWQRVEADLNRRWLGSTLASASLNENVRILLLCVWERVCNLSSSVHKSWVVNAIVWV